MAKRSERRQFVIGDTIRAIDFQGGGTIVMDGDQHWAAAAVCAMRYLRIRLPG